MKPLSPWAQEAHDHWKKYRPRMYQQLEQSGQLENALQNAVERAKNQYVESVYNGGMDSLEAQSEAKRQHLFLPSEKDMPSLGEDPEARPDPASLVTIPGPRYRSVQSQIKKPKATRSN